LSSTATANSPRRKKAKRSSKELSFRWKHATCTCAHVIRRHRYGMAPEVKRLDSVCSNRAYPDYYVRGICEECRADYLFQEHQERRRLGLLPLHVDQANHWREEARGEFQQVMAALRAGQLELPAESLPSEDVEDLVSEIARWRQSGKVIVVYDDDTIEEIPDPDPPAPPGPAMLQDGAAPTPRRRKLSAA
jgi:hypothetical protein